MPIDRRRFITAASAAGTALALQPRKAFAMSPQPFKVAVYEAVLDRIRSRVRAAHRPHTAVGTGWRYGPDAAWFDALLAHWSERYDWRGAEKAINRLPQFTAVVLGRRLHFVHLPHANPAAPALVLLHGWPYSFYSFSDVIGPLAQDFHVVVPSLPGFHFSEPPADAPRGLRLIARHVHALLTQTLGYERFIAQGSAHGAVVADWLALDTPESLLGEHTNLIALRHAGAEYASGETGGKDAAPVEQRFVVAEQATFKAETAYFELQRTRPETIAWAMANSPVGTAAYILDKWQKWTDLRSRDLDEVYGFDRLITEVMLYIVTNSFPTSLWPYAGFELEPFSIPPGRTIDVPFGFSGYPDPLNAPPPRAFAERGRTQIISWEIASAGGHFPFLENPAGFVSSVCGFARTLRER